MEVLQRTANRGSISTGGYEIDNSLKFERANSEKLARTPSSASNSKTWTYSFWLKRTQLGINSYHLEAKGTGDKFFIFGFNENDQILFYDIFSTDYGKAFTRRFRDTSAWYHIVLRADTTDGTASNRMRLYVNGIQETTVTSDYGDFPQNHDTQINKAVVHNIGYRTDINQYASGYMAETCLIDGTSLGPDSFGEFDSDTGIWKPIDVSDLTFGTNGFYQDYKTGADLGADKVSGGNSNDYTETNIAAADQATDTPTNNFATFNPIWTAADITYSEGATRMTSGANGWETALSTIGVSSGKWYFEIKQSATDGSAMYGVADEADIYNLLTDHLGSNNTGGNSVSYYGNDGVIRINGVGVVTYGTWAQNQKMGCALDLDNGKVYFALHNTWQNSSNPENGTNALTLPTGGNGLWFFGANQYFGSETLNANFGGYTSFGVDSAETDENGYGSFEFAPPSGYYALCTKNLAEYG